MQTEQTPQQPKFPVSIMAYAIIDAVGIVLFAIGALWLAQEKATIFTDFPANMTDALMTTISGLLLTTWAASRIIRVLIRRRPATARKTNTP